MLFGTIPHGEAGNRERVQEAFTGVLDQLGLGRTIVELGLSYAVGTGGSRLSRAQRQKMAIAIAVLKRPDLIALSDATIALDGEVEAAIFRRLKDEFVGRSLFCSLHRTKLASAFERILIMEQGRLVAQGDFAELQTRGKALAPLMAAK